ncbi:hypothetical protein [Bradyrhizobium sp. USDA 10063]
MMDLVKTNGRAAPDIAMHNVAADINDRSVTTGDDSSAGEKNQGEINLNSAQRCAASWRGSA